MDNILKVTGTSLDCQQCSSGQHVVGGMSPAYLWIRKLSVLSCIGISLNSFRVMCTWASCCNYVCGHGSKSLPLPPLYHSLRKRCDPKSFEDVKRTFYEAAKTISNKPPKKTRAKF